MTLANVKKYSPGELEAEYETLIGWVEERFASIELFRARGEDFELEVEDLLEYERLVRLEFLLND